MLTPKIKKILSEKRKTQLKKNNKTYREKLKYYGYKQIVIFVPKEIRENIKDIIYSMIKKYEEKKKSLRKK